MVPYMFAVNEYFVVEKIITLLFERNKLIINILLKDVSNSCMWIVIQSKWQT